MTYKKIIVIPTFNESKRLNVQRFHEFFGSVKSKNTLVIFSNDGSNDNTLEVLKEIKKKFNSKTIIHDFSINEGKSETIRKSFIKCVNDYNFEVISFLDCDLSTDIFECNELMDDVSDDKVIVFGSRISKIDNQIERRFIRHILGRLFSTVTYCLFNIKSYDSQCGCKCFRKKIVDDLFQKKFESNWIFDIEIFLRLKNIGFDLERNTIEKPLNRWIDREGSKISFFYFLLIWVDLYKIYKKY